MIKMKDGIIIDAEKIVAISQEYTGRTQIDTVCEVFYTSESPDEVVRKVLEYRLAMARHMAASQAAYFHRAKTENPYTPPLENWNELEELAGLEAKSHE